MSWYIVKNRKGQYIAQQIFPEPGEAIWSNGMFAEEFHSRSEAVEWITATERDHRERVRLMIDIGIAVTVVAGVFLVMWIMGEGVVKALAKFVLVSALFLLLCYCETLIVPAGVPL